MTHRDLLTLVDYNYWARDRILGAVSPLTLEQYTQPLGNSFSSVRDTLVHLKSAEWVWFMRWQGNAPTAPLDPASYPDLPTLVDAWRALEAKFRAFIDGLGDGGVDRALEYRAMNGQAFQSTIAQMVQHVVNHGTYHRGQVITLLRLLGAKPVGTDLIAYQRERTIA